MPEFYYQIKARQDSDCDYNRWIWPPVFTGKVEAEDKAAARKMIDEEYGQKFPMRVLQKDIASAHFLLNIEEIKSSNRRMQELFDIKSCKQCSNGFRVIDSYNNGNQKYVGRDFCSDECSQEYKKEHDARMFQESYGGRKYPAVIYRITNSSTGMSYVGQTSQPFTLRWWQHFFNGTDTKLHKAIAESKMSDWTFSVIEVIDLEAKAEGQSVSDYMHEREQFWITQLNCIECGYNSATSKAMPVPSMQEEMAL